MGCDRMYCTVMFSNMAIDQWDILILVLYVCQFNTLDIAHGINVNVGANGMSLLLMAATRSCDMSCSSLIW